MHFVYSGTSDRATNLFGYLWVELENPHWRQYTGNARKSRTRPDETTMTTLPEKRTGHTPNSATPRPPITPSTPIGQRMPGWLPSEGDGRTSIGEHGVLTLLETPAGNVASKERSRALTAQNFLFCFCFFFFWGFPPFFIGSENSAGTKRSIRMVVQAVREGAKGSGLRNPAGETGALV